MFWNVLEAYWCLFSSLFFKPLLTFLTIWLHFATATLSSWRSQARGTTQSLELGSQFSFFIPLVSAKKCHSMTRFILVCGEQPSPCPAQLGLQQLVNRHHPWLLVLHIHVLRQYMNDVDMLQSLEVTGTFDKVVPVRLLHNMRERYIPDLILNRVGSFIRSRTTTLCLPEYNTDSPMHTSIPYGWPLLHVLFLSFNANLIDACDPLSFSASGTCLEDDMNAFASSNETYENSITQQIVHKCCSEWARRHEASIALEKYIHVHFTKARTKHNSACPLILHSSTSYPCTNAHDLGMILNKNLRCQLNLQHIKSLLITQTNIFSRLTALTWGTSLRVSRFLFIAVVRLAITTDCST
jgi:hypothetical protein